MYRYYNNKRVRVLRFFALNGTHYAVIYLNQEEVTVETKELSENKSETVQSEKGIESIVSKINADGSENVSTLFIPAQADRDIFHKVEWKSAEEAVTVSDEGLTSSINVSDESVQIDSPKIVIDGEVSFISEDKETVEHVIATNNNGKEIDLGNILDLEDSPILKKYKFDVEAIKRCLNGQQKRHKNYAFATREVGK